MAQQSHHQSQRPQHDEYKMVGHYKVKASLGEGVNGAVRLGVDVRTGEKVCRHRAIVAGDPIELTRTRRPAPAARRWRHTRSRSSSCSGPT